MRSDLQAVVSTRISIEVPLWGDMDQAYDLARTRFGGITDWFWAVPADLWLRLRDLAAENFELPGLSNITVLFGLPIVVGPAGGEVTLTRALPDSVVPNG